MANEVRTFTLNDDPGQVIEDLNAAFDGTTQTALKAGDVKDSINGVPLSSIFESNGTTVKEATHAATATKADLATNVSTSTLVFSFSYPATNDMSPYYKFYKTKILTTIVGVRHTSTVSAITFGLYLSGGTQVGTVTIAAGSNIGSTTVSYSFASGSMIYVKCTSGDGASVATVELVMA